MDPQAVADRKVRYRADGQSLARPSYFGLNAGAIQVECRAPIRVRRSNRKHQEQTPK